MDIFVAKKGLGASYRRPRAFKNASGTVVSSSHVKVIDIDFKATETN